MHLYSYLPPPPPAPITGRHLRYLDPRAALQLRPVPEADQRHGREACYRDRAGRPGAIREPGGAEVLTETPIRPNKKQRSAAPRGALFSHTTTQRIRRNHADAVREDLRL